MIPFLAGYNYIKNSEYLIHSYDRGIAQFYFCNSIGQQYAPLGLAIQCQFGLLRYNNF